MGSFVARIIKHAVKTDRGLRGRGHPKSVEEFNASRFHSAANAEIERLKAAHLALIPASKMTRSLVRRLEGFFSSWRGIISIISILLALLGIVGSILLR